MQVAAMVLVCTSAALDRPDRARPANPARIRVVFLYIETPPNFNLKVETLPGFKSLSGCGGS
jgi:hypothetical protein